MKTIFLTSLLAVALSSSAAFAQGRYHHQHVISNYGDQHAREFYDLYQSAPTSAQASRYRDPFGTYSTLPSPVSDQ